MLLGLANVTFAWMVQQLGPYLAFEDWTWGSKGIAGYQQRVSDEEWRYGSMKKPSTVEKVESTVAGWGHWIFEQGKKVVSGEVKMVPVSEQKIKDPPKTAGKGGKPIRWAISEYQDSYTRMYQAISDPVDRTPGECTDRSTEKRTPLKELGRTNEYIHPAVWWRVKNMRGEKGDKKYLASPLKDFERGQDPTYGSWGYLKKSTAVWIPEWFMKPTELYMAGRENRKPEGHDEEWEHAEWTYTDGTYADAIVVKKELLDSLAQFYLDGQAAEKKMTAMGKVFPFEVGKLDHVNKHA